MATVNLFSCLNIPTCCYHLIKKYSNYFCILNYRNLYIVGRVIESMKFWGINILNDIFKLS